MLKQSLQNIAYTENGALSNKSTNSKLLDFFAQGGSSRNKSDKEIIMMFEEAFAENPKVATVLLFYFRDIRGGQGERRLFRVLVNHLAKISPEYLRPIMSLIPEYGRWDDVYSFVGTPLEAEAFQLMKKQWDADLESKYPSLLAKWLKGTSSSAGALELAKITYAYFGLTPRQYSKTLSRLRAKTKILERLMSLGQWDQIDYSAVPSQAMKRYFKAFLRNDHDRFTAYLEALNSGEKSVKINASTLHPHEIVSQALRGSKVADAQWKALPKYSLDHTLSVVDTSGSMGSRISDKSSISALDVALALGLYTAEHMEGEFKDSFITFSHKPALQTIQGNTLLEKLNNLRRADWSMNTDFQAVFNLILQTGRLNNIPDELMPKRVLVISDMEFDATSSSWYGVDIPTFNHQALREKYKSFGYTMPQLVYWNVNARNRQFPITSTEYGLMVSGYSPSILSYIYEGVSLTPYDLMMRVYDGDRYSALRDALDKI